MWHGLWLHIMHNEHCRSCGSAMFACVYVLWQDGTDRLDSIRSLELATMPHGGASLSILSFLMFWEADTWSTLYVLHAISATVTSTNLHLGLAETDLWIAVFAFIAQLHADELPCKVPKSLLAVYIWRRGKQCPNLVTKLRICITPRVYSGQAVIVLCSMCLTWGGCNNLLNLQDRTSRTSSSCFLHGAATQTKIYWDHVLACAIVHAERCSK